MANAFLTPTHLSRMTLAHLENELVLAKTVQHDYSSEYAAVGDTINIRRPVRMEGQENNLDLSSFRVDLEEGKVPITMDKSFSIAYEIDPKDLTLSVEMISERYARPAAIKIRDYVETQIANLYTKVYWFNGTPGTTLGTFKALAQTGATLTNAAVPHDRRCAVHDPLVAVELADGLKDVYVQDKARTAFERVQIGNYGGFANMESVHIPKHTVGVNTGTPLVNGGSQNVTYAASKNTGTQTLNTDGWTNSTTGILKAGDVFTIADVYAVNPISKQSTGQLQTFVVRADADSGASTGPAALTISPPIITSGPYQTVDSVPADDAAITVKTGTGGTQYSQSLAYHKDAFTLVSRPLKIDSGSGLKTYTANGNHMSISVSETTAFDTLKKMMRFDVLFGVEAVRPDLAARITS